MSSSHYILAQKGNIFVLTETGFEHCKRFCEEKVLKERQVGKSVGQYVDNVPASWVKKGWVKEISMK